MAKRADLSKSDVATKDTATKESAAKEAVDAEAVSPLDGSRALADAVTPRLVAEPIETAPEDDAPVEAAQPADGGESSGDPGHDADPAAMIDLTDGTVDAPSANGGARIVSDVTKEPRTDPAATIDQSSPTDDPPPDQGDAVGGRSDDAVEGVDTSNPDETATGPRAAVDVNDEQGMRGWAVEQFGEEAVAEQEAGGGSVASADGGGGGGGSSMPTHGTADVPQGAEFPERNPLAGEEGEQLQSLESLDSLVDAGSGVPGMASPEGGGLSALVIPEEQTPDIRDLASVSDGMATFADGSAYMQDSSEGNFLIDLVTGKNYSGQNADKRFNEKQSEGAKVDDTSGNLVIPLDSIDPATPAIPDTGTTTVENGVMTTTDKDGQVTTATTNGSSILLEGQSLAGSPAPTGDGKNDKSGVSTPTEEGSHTDVSGHRQMIDSVQKHVMDTNPADTGNVNPVRHDYGTGEPIAEPDRAGIENPNEYGAGRASAPDIPDNQGGLIAPSDEDDIGVGGDGSYNTDTDIDTNVNDDTVDLPTDSGDSGDGYEVVTTFDPNAQPTEPYVADDALPGE